MRPSAGRSAKSTFWRAPSAAGGCVFSPPSGIRQWSRGSSLISVSLPSARALRPRGRPRRLRGSSTSAPVESQPSEAQARAECSLPSASRATREGAGWPPARRHRDFGGQVPYACRKNGFLVSSACVGYGAITSTRPLVPPIRARRRDFAGQVPYAPRRNGASRVWAASDIEALRQLGRLSRLSSADVERSVSAGPISASG